MRTKENGVTLIALVITIILLLILATVGTSVGTSVLDSSAFTQFKSELKVMQSKVNELNQKNENEIGTDLNEEQKAVLNIESVSNIIYKDISDSDKSTIQEGFKYCDKKYIQDNFGLDSVKRDYLINVEYRYVIFPEGFEYKNKTYYMIDQIDSELYNVRYNDKNKKSGDFEVNSTMGNNKCKITISDINYDGYIDKWQVRYKLENDSFWKTSDDLSFYVREDGVYNINVVHGDEIDLGTKSVKVVFNGLISDKVKSKIVKVGDYVQYTPDDMDNTLFENLKSNLNEFSGNSSSTVNPSIERNDLKWRVLDITDDGKVRLISATPTDSKIELKGYNGYNNAVKLLDDACSTLYTNSKLASKVQNLKIEDITKYMATQPILDTTPYSPTDKYYPEILLKEKEQTVNETAGSELDLSEQTKYINQTTKSQVTSWTLKKTCWVQTMNNTDSFKDSKYYELFINNGSDYSTYWMSSRCVDAYSNIVGFNVHIVSSGNVNSDLNSLCNSRGSEASLNYAFRPVITLNSDVQVDTSDITKDGSTAANAWIIK